MGAVTEEAGGLKAVALIILDTAIIFLLAMWAASVGTNEHVPRDPAEYSWRVGEPILTEYWIDKGEP